MSCNNFKVCNCECEPQKSCSHSKSRSRSRSRSASRSCSPDKPKPRILPFPVPLISIENHIRPELRCQIKKLIRKHKFCFSNSCLEQWICKGEGSKGSESSSSDSDNESKECGKKPKKNKKCERLPTLLVDLEHDPKQPFPVANVRFVYKHKRSLKCGNEKKFHVYLNIFIPFSVNVCSDYAHPMVTLRPLEHPLESIEQVILREVRESLTIMADCRSKCDKKHSHQSGCLLDTPMNKIRFSIEHKTSLCDCGEDSGCHKSSSSSSLISKMDQLYRNIKNIILPCHGDEMKECDKRDQFAINAHNITVKVQRKITELFHPMTHSVAVVGDNQSEIDRAFCRFGFFAQDDVMEDICDENISDQFDINFFVTWLDKRNDPWVDQQMLISLQAEIDGIDAELAKLYLKPETADIRARIKELNICKSHKANDLIIIQNRVNDRSQHLEGESLCLDVCGDSACGGDKQYFIPIRLPQMFAVKAKWVPKRNCKDTLKLQYVHIMYADSQPDYQCKVEDLQKKLNELFRQCKHEFEISGYCKKTC